MEMTRGQQAEVILERLLKVYEPETRSWRDSTEPGEIMVDAVALKEVPPDDSSDPKALMLLQEIIDEQALEIARLQGPVADPPGTAGEDLPPPAGIPGAETPLRGPDQVVTPGSIEPDENQGPGAIGS